MKTKPCIKIYRTDNGWVAELHGDEFTTKTYTIPETYQPEEEQKAERETLIDLLNDICETLWIRNSKHNQYNLEFKIIKQKPA